MINNKSKNKFIYLGKSKYNPLILSFCFPIIYLSFFAMSMFVKTTLVLLFLLLIVSVSNVIKVRKNILLVIIFLIILYCNYSFICLNFIKQNYIYSEFKYTIGAYRTLQAVCLLNLIILIFLPKKIDKINTEDPFAKNKIHILIHLAIILILAIILMFGYKSNSFGVRGTYNPCWGYFVVILLFGLFFSSGRNYLKYTYFAIAILYCLINLIFKERQYILQILMILFVYFCPKKLMRNKPLVVILGIIGYFSLVFVGNFRGGEDISFLDSLILNIKSIIKSLFAFDTAGSAFYTSQTFIKQAFIDTDLKRITMFGLFVLSLIFGGSAVPGANLALYTRQNFFHSYGGCYAAFGYYYFGFVGVALFAFYLIYLLRLIVNFDMKDLNKLLAISIMSSTFMWYLYSPFAILRTLALVIIVYYAIIFSDKLLKRVLSKFQSKNR